MTASPSTLQRIEGEAEGLAGGGVVGGAIGAADPAAAENTVKSVSNAVPGLDQIGTFFSSLSQANTWIRVGQVVLGLMLVSVGVARLTHAVSHVEKAASAIGKVIPV